MVESVRIKQALLFAGWAVLVGLSGCNATEVRDALQGGFLDFVSGTVADTLTALFPLADAVGG